VKTDLAWFDGAVVLVGSEEPALYALDPDSGQILWRAVTDHPPRTVSVDGDQMFVGTFGGMLNAYRW
jgi:outer membrane protein assembly factor BamB